MSTAETREYILYNFVKFEAKGWKKSDIDEIMEHVEEDASFVRSPSLKPKPKKAYKSRSKGYSSNDKKPSGSSGQSKKSYRSKPKQSDTSLEAERQKLAQEQQRLKEQQERIREQQKELDEQKQQLNQLRKNKVQDNRTPQEILGLTSSSFTTQELREAWIRESKRWHPSNMVNKPQELVELAEAEMKKVNVAYDTLKKRTN